MSANPPPRARRTLLGGGGSSHRYTDRMEPKAELHALIDRLSDADALKLLDFVNNLSDPDTLTDQEMAELLLIEAEMESGDYVTLAELRVADLPSR